MYRGWQRRGIASQISRGGGVFGDDGLPWWWPGRCRHDLRSQKSIVEKKNFRQVFCRQGFGVISLPLSVSYEGRGVTTTGVRDKHEGVSSVPLGHREPVSVAYRCRE